MKLRKESIAGILLVLVSASVMVLSVIFTYKTNCERLGSVIALIFSCAIVIFNTIALTVASLFFRNKTIGSVFVALMLIFMFMFTTSYSITNTMNIMYEGNRITVQEFKEEQINIDGSREILNLKRQLVADKDIEIAEKNKAIESKEADVEKYDNMEGYPTRAFQARQARDKLIAEKSVLLQEKQDINREIEQLMKETPRAVTEEETKKNDSVYAYYAELFNREETDIRNIIDLIPAFFLDLIAPITMGLAVYFFGDDKKKKLVPELKEEIKEKEAALEIKETIQKYRIAEKPDTRDQQVISILERQKNRAENSKDEASRIRIGMLKDEYDKLYEYKNRELYEKIVDKQDE